MNLKKYKKEFSIFVFDENPAQARYIKEILLKDGYETHFYTSEELFLQAIYLTLPHIVILPSLEKTAFMAEEIRKISREIQIFAVGASSEAERLHRWLEMKLIYDYVLDPVTLPAQLLHRVARATESWVQMTNQAAQKLPTPSLDPSSAAFSTTAVAAQKAEAPLSPTRQKESMDFVETPAAALSAAPINDFGLGDLLHCESEEVAIQFALKRLQDFCKKDFLYLKFDAQTENLSLMDLASGMTPRHRNIGIKLESVQDLAHFFLHAQDYKIWSDFFAHVFHADQTTVHLVKNKEGILGLLVAVGELAEDQKSVADKFSRGLSLILDNHAKSRLIFDHLPIELKSFCLNNKSFYEKLNGEISRARRHKQAVSVVSFEIRGITPAQTQRSMALVAKVIKRFSRGSDFVGRITDHRLALALPQTEQDKAAFVGSRLVLIAQKALAEKGLDQVQVFCGVSTFPDLANDTMALLEGSEEAASQAKSFEVVLYTIESMGAFDLQN